MISKNKNISIDIVYDGDSYNIKTYYNEYRNLMMLIYDNLYPDDFGDCMGMGKCGTCLIEILEFRTMPAFLNRNEETTIQKHNIGDKNVRLACQILIDEHLDGLKIKILK